MFHITAVDLYGNAFYTDTIPLPYSNTPDYYKQVTDAVKEFISSRQYDNDKVLGISIATQGITSPDHTTVLYGDIMNNAGMKLDDFPDIFHIPVIWNMIRNQLHSLNYGIIRSLTVLLSSC